MVPFFLGTHTAGKLHGLVDAVADPVGVTLGSEEVPFLTIVLRR